jgi:hypothetical protein
MDLDAQFEALSTQKGLTPQGRAWLKVALDPFHDTESTLAGFPDNDDSPSCIQFVKKSFSYTTTGVESAVNFIMTPFMKGTYINSSGTLNLNGGQVTGGVAFPASLLFGGLALQTTLATGPTTPITLLDPSEFVGSNTRIIAMGFEVHDVTNELQETGTCTVWQAPVYQEIGAVTPNGFIDTAGLVAATPVPVNSYSIFPATLDQIMLLSGSRQWAAYNGSYTVSKMSSTVNPYATRTTSVAMYIDPYNPSSSSTSAVIYYGIKTSGSIPAGTAAPNIPGTSAPIFSPFLYHGAHYSALPVSVPPATPVLQSFTLTAHWILETAPGPNDPLITLASPSAQFDPAALELYGAIVKTRAPGAQVAENSLGGWFNDIVGAMKSIVMGSSEVPRPIPTIRRNSNNNLRRVGDNRIIGNGSEWEADDRRNMSGPRRTFRSRQNFRSVVEPFSRSTMPEGESLEDQFSTMDLSGSLNNKDNISHEWLQLMLGLQNYNLDNNTSLRPCDLLPEHLYDEYKTIPGAIAKRRFLNMHRKQILNTFRDFLIQRDDEISDVDENEEDEYFKSAGSGSKAGYYESGGLDSNSTADSKSLAVIPTGGLIGGLVSKYGPKLYDAVKPRLVDQTTRLASTLGKNTLNRFTPDMDFDAFDQYRRKSAVNIAKAKGGGLRVNNALPSRFNVFSRGTRSQGVGRRGSASSINSRTSLLGKTGSVTKRAAKGITRAIPVVGRVAGVATRVNRRRERRANRV